MSSSVLATGAHEHLIAAWFKDRPITVAAVRARESALRAGPYAARLPMRKTPQGRNVVRWIVQLIATEEIIAAEADRRGIALSGPWIRPELKIESALELGGVLATVLASMPLAAAVRDAVTATVRVSDEAARQYYERNADQFRRPESRELDRVVDDHSVGWNRVVASELPPDWERAIFAARIGETVAVRDDRVFVVRDIYPASIRDFDTVAGQITAELLDHARNACFADWVQQQQRQWLRLEHGYEHPGDPHHPDATHRH